MHWTSLINGNALDKFEHKKIVFYSSLLQYPNKKKNENQNIEMTPKRGDTFKTRDIYTHKQKRIIQKK